MKDYRLSEIKAICEAHESCINCPLRLDTLGDGRHGCQFYGINDTTPDGWEIEDGKND